LPISRRIDPPVWSRDVGAIVRSVLDGIATALSAAMELSTICSHAMSTVVGGLSENACRGIGMTAGAVAGAVASRLHLKQDGILVRGTIKIAAGALNVGSDITGDPSHFNRDVGMGMLDTAGAGASVLGGKVGAAGTVYTLARAGGTIAAKACGY
jgi:hypothetical protein